MIDDRALVQAVGAVASTLNRIESDDGDFKKAVINTLSALVEEQAKMEFILAQMIAASGCIPPTADQK